MDKIVSIKIKQNDGTYSNEIPVSVLAENVEWDSNYNLIDILGNVNINGAGNIQYQINQLINQKVSHSDLSNYVNNQLNTTVENWLDTNVNPVGSAVIVDQSLNISGAAADAKAVGDTVSSVNYNVGRLSSGDFSVKKEIDTGTWAIGSVTTSGIKPSQTAEAHSGIFEIGDFDYLDVSLEDESCRFIIYRYDGTNYSLIPTVNNIYIARGGVRITDKQYKYIIRIASIPYETIADPGVYKSKVKVRGGRNKNLLYTKDIKDIFDKRKIDLHLDIPMAMISVGSSGYSANTGDVSSMPVSIGDYDSILFKIVNTSCHFAVFSYDGSTYSPLSGGWVGNDVEYTDKSVQYIVRISMIGVPTITAEQFVEICNSVQIHLQIKDDKHDTVYGYDRQYTDITSDLTFERKAISASGIEDSELSLLAKLPNDGNIECRLNRPAGKFSVWKSSGSGFTQLADWTYYQYRYTGDYSSDYYVAIATPDNTSITLSYYNAISVYKFLDVGISYNANNKLSGKSIAVFGDSIVQGRMVKNSSSVNCTMPKPYSNLISEIAGTEAHNFGIGGALVYDNNWKSLVRNYQFVTGFDVVFICAGTNDFGQSISLEDFRIAYETVVNALIQSNVEVVVCTPTRRSTNGTIGGNTLQNFADIEIDIAETHDLKVINLYALTNTTVFKNQLPDGLHPNEIGAKMIADIIVENY